jgi:type II secretory ATPase GspE/PulE/Tfp pilus assembly ATPase PilB-like protein
MEIVRLGYQAGASDVHLQAQRDGVVLRLRIDGVMNTILTIPHDVYFPYGKKLKFIAGTKMNIDHLPQDGRFSIQAKNNKNHDSTIDVRTSFMPGI